MERVRMQDESKASVMLTIMAVNERHRLRGEAIPRTKKGGGYLEKIIKIAKNRLRQTVSKDELSEEDLSEISIRIKGTGKLEALNDVGKVREAALIFVQMAGVFRIQELLDLTWKDVKMRDEIKSENAKKQWIEVYVAKSKTDQLGKGDTVVVSANGANWCPFRWMRHLHKLMMERDRAGPNDPVFAQTGGKEACKGHGIKQQTAKKAIKIELDAEAR